MTENGSLYLKDDENLLSDDSLSSRSGGDDSSDSEFEWYDSKDKDVYFILNTQYPY